jgi:hypothetical protein
LVVVHFEKSVFDKLVNKTDKNENTNEPKIVYSQISAMFSNSPK